MMMSHIPAWCLMVMTTTTMNNTVPEFAIFQNDKTKVSGIWTKEKGKWIEAPESDYVILGLIAKLIRTSPNPINIIESIKLGYETKDKQINWDTEPGFFIPPEELDGL